MKVGEKVIFFDENKKQLTGIVSALRVDKINQENGKVIRSNLIDVKVSRMQGVFQTYESVPLKQDLEEGEKTFCYELVKKQKKSTNTDSTISNTITTNTDNITTTVSDTANKIKSIFTKSK